MNITDQEFYKLLDRVDKLERQVQFLLGQAPVPYVDQPPSAGGGYPDVVALKRNGKLIDAIKLYRSYTGASLEAAKEYVEKFL